ncbi:hypothetical protein GCM10028818_52370 [Spirosoma horti]
MPGQAIGKPVKTGYFPPTTSFALLRTSALALSLTLLSKVDAIAKPMKKIGVSTLFPQNRQTADGYKELGTIQPGGRGV